MLAIVVKAFLSAVLEVGCSASTIGAFAGPSSATTGESVAPEPGTRRISWSFASRKESRHDSKEEMVG
ncbi:MULTISPECIES: hypothetical protein [unclassified Mesorhizobium]|uniref:hypothetical protein n=1 Tax=unclassified Mesorhizobium TaxID=325217 RepID=UPI002415AFA6|nr:MULTISPECIES: hypothetical protein [unclassified Mesorhizobium]MDG4894159.1 hypothetical protein [Mesorhizobium sp. WSM4976]